MPPMTAAKTFSSSEYTLTFKKVVVKSNIS